MYNEVALEHALQHGTHDKDQSGRAPWNRLEVQRFSFEAERGVQNGSLEMDSLGGAAAEP